MKRRHLHFLLIFTPFSSSFFSRRHWPCKLAAICIGNFFPGAAAFAADEKEEENGIGTQIEKVSWLAAYRREPGK